METGESHAKLIMKGLLNQMKKDNWVMQDWDGKDWTKEDLMKSIEKLKELKKYENMFDTDTRTY